ncbi:MAG TPA: hypothetical protein PLN30_09890, partial [Ferruginibacter sp.]|nr:hypothetical protein [Ferruginibacter sp.]
MKEKFFCSIILLVFTLTNYSFAQNKIENIIIITTDGLRWQEVFKGADERIMNNATFVQDTVLT